MAQTCTKHYSDLSTGMCQRCGLWYCESCLVYAFGPAKPPFCTACAMAVSGVRTTGKIPPARPPKEIKRELRAWRKEAKRQRAAAHESVGAEAAPERELVEAASDSQFDQEVANWRNGDVMYEDVASGH